jgi:phosphatidate cytidylyltransferase
MKARVITTIVGLPLILFLFYIGGYGLLLCVTALVGFSTVEYVKAVNNILTQKINVVLILILNIFLVFILFYYPEATIFTLIIGLIIIFIYEIIAKQSELERGIFSTFSLLYNGLMFGTLLLFDNLGEEQILIWTILIIGFVTDTSAFLVGRKIGKHKLAPAISPKKSLEGAISGTLFAAVATVIYGIILNNYFAYDFNYFMFIILGLIGSIAGQCGDLTASMIKRRVKIKDFGKILPGHGGILDRFDSILFIIPIVYFFAFLFIN